MRPLANAVGATLLLATLGTASLAAESAGNNLRRTTAEPAAWQGPVLTAQLVPPAGRDSVAPRTVTPSADQPAANPDPGVIITPSSTPKQNESPLLDGKLPAEDLLPPVVSEGNSGGSDGGHHAVEPYGGGHPTDWSWGCGGNPYRTGPGLCDNYKVGPRWHVTVDGIVMHRDGTDLVALASAMPASFTGPNVPSGIPTGVDPGFEQFGYGPGGRIAFTSQVGACSGYDVQGVYEGINDWNASIVFPKQPFTPVFYTPGVPVTTSVTTSNGATPPVTTTVTTTAFPAQPVAPPLQPPSPFPEGFEQRSLHYRSNMNSVELNWLPDHESEWRPIFGARFIRFDDEISDSLNQEVQTPLPFEGVNPAAGQFLGTSETDRLNLFHTENNLMGFQVGLLHDTMQINNRLAIEGFVNGGVYYNQVKYSNVMVVRTTQIVTDDTATTGFSESRTDSSTAVNNDARDMSEISYEAEASITGVCRLNKCWALRGGYQVLWLNHLHMADSAYLGSPEAASDLLFHGWHVGLECRR